MTKSNWIKPLSYALILFIGPLLTYYLVYVQSREEALLDRSFSHLTNIASRTEGRINNVFTVIKNACPKKIKPTISGSTSETKGDNSTTSSESNGFTDVEMKQALARNDLGLEVKSEKPNCGGINADSPRSVQPLNRNTLEFTLGDLKVDADISKLIGDLDVNNRFADVFIFDESGNVIYQRLPENGRIQNLDELLDDSKNSEEKQKRLINDPLEYLRISYRGRSYLMPSQPLQIAFKQLSNVSTQESDKEYDKWLMASLIEERQFNSEKLQFQPDTVAIVVFLISIIVLSGPFLKIWYLGRFESFKKLDVILLIASGFTLSSILTIFIIQLDARHGINDFMEARLKALSSKLADDIRDELVVAIEELQYAEMAMSDRFNQAGIKEKIEQLILSDEESELTNVELSDENKEKFLNKARANINQKECLYLASEDDPPGRDFSLRDGDLLTGDNMNYRAQDYPFFTMAYLMDANGCQIAKWTTLEYPTSAGQFEDRSYFLRPLANARLPSKLYSVENSKQDPDQASTKKQFFMEFITSRTTGEKSIALSTPVGGLSNGDIDSANGARVKCLESNNLDPQPCVAVMSMSSLRAMQAVLPFGFGFAIVNRDGDILVHHEGNASTELNLVNELADGEVLQSALYGKDAREFNAGYHNDLFHFRVEPLKIKGSGFSLVTFYSKNTVLMPYLESVGMSLISWLVWFSVFFFLALTIWQCNKFFEGHPLAVINKKLTGKENYLLVGTVFALLLCIYEPYFSLLSPLYIVAVLLLYLFKVSVNFRSQPKLVVGITAILVLSGSSLPILGLFSLYKTEAFAGYLQLQIVDHNAQVERQRQQIRNWLSVRKTANDDITYNYLARGEFSNTNPYTKQWRRYPLFNLENKNSAHCFRNAYEENSQENYQASNDYVKLKPAPYPREINPPRSVLSRLPDYSDRTVQLHAMYRSPKYFDIASKDCSVKDVSLRLASGQSFNFISNTSGLFVIGFFVILAVVLWYVLVRTLGLRSENYLRLLNFNLPERNSGSRDLIYGLGEDSKQAFFSKADQSRINWLDLRALSLEEAATAVDELGKTFANESVHDKDILVLNHFDDCLIDQKVVQARTVLLEKLVRLDQLSIVLLLNVDPLSYITSTFDIKEEATLISRLASLLTHFSVSYYQEDPPKVLGESREDYILREECYHPNLRAIYDSIHERSSQRSLDNNEIIQLVKSRANAIYQQMWNLCTHAEKIMLIDLAHENLVNPNNWDVARLLKQRGYLRRDPFHRIFNESFKQFILQMEQLENTQAWRRESGSTWHNIRLPLFVTVIGAIIFLAFTQPSFFNSVFAFAAAGTASLPFLVNLIMAKLKSGGDN